MYRCILSLQCCQIFLFFFYSSLGRCHKVIKRSAEHKHFFFVNTFELVEYAGNSFKLQYYTENEMRKVFYFGCDEKKHRNSS